MNFPDLFPLADMAAHGWIPVLAIILDAVLGDPPRWPHPVRLIGALCDRVESFARNLVSTERLAGIVAVGCVLASTWLAVRILLLFPSFFAVGIAVYLGFAGLAQGQLLREGRKALALLEGNDIEGARHAVGMLVSRDVSEADRPDLCRALAETLAENFNDAFIAPLFWFVLGGPVALWLYKAVSTMDSMWGYPHEPWTRFGTAAARLDDALAWIPARLAALFLYLASRLRIALSRLFETKFPTPDDPWPGIGRVAQDARTMKSPNAGWPMAASAWIHDSSMGGPTTYADVIVEKPELGPSGRPWTEGRLAELFDNIALAGICGSILLIALGWSIHAFLL